MKDNLTELRKAKAPPNPLNPWRSMGSVEDSQARNRQATKKANRQRGLDKRVKALGDDIMQSLLGAEAMKDTLTVILAYLLALFVILCLLAPVRASAATIVSIVTTDEFLSREELTPGCEYLDTFEETTVTTYREHRVTTRYGVFDGGEFGKPVVYKPGPYPCFRDDLTHEEKWQRGCDPEPIVGYGDGIVVSDSTSREWTETDVSTRLLYVNTCEGKECPPHQTPVPESNTFLLLAGVGLVVIGKELKQYRGNTK